MTILFRSEWFSNSYFSRVIFLISIIGCHLISFILRFSEILRRFQIYPNALTWKLKFHQIRNKYEFELNQPKCRFPLSFTMLPPYYDIKFSKKKYLSIITDN